MLRDTRRKFLALSKTMEPKIRFAFLSAIRDVRSASKISLLEEAISGGDVDAIMRVLQLNEALFAPLDDAIRTAFLAGGAYQLNSVPKKTPDPLTGGRLVIRFGGNEPRAQEIIRAYGASLVTNLIEGQREVIADIIADGLADNRAPRRIALDLAGRVTKNGRTGGVIGLTAPNARTVQRARHALSVGDAKGIRSYLTLKARDRRFDPTARRALNGEKLSPADVSRITGRLSDRYLIRRAQAIAEQEAMTAISVGRHEAVDQLIDRGVPVDAVTHGWDATGDARTRSDHMAMDGQKKPFKEPFVAPDGSKLMHPRDTSLDASADQVQKCRCYERIYIDWLSQAV